MLQCLASTIPLPSPVPPPPPSLDFAKIRLVWKDGSGEGERKGENGRKGLNHWPAKLQRGAFDEFNGRRTHPKWGTHDGPRPIAEARGDLGPRSFVGERGDSRMVGWQGGSWDDRFLLPWEETLFSNGFHFGCRQPDAPSVLQGEGGRKEET